MESPVVESTTWQTLRSRWSEVINRAALGNVQFELTFRGGAPTAVLMSVARWEAGQKLVPTGEPLDLTAGPAKTDLRRIREWTQADAHVVLTRYGKPEVVFAPVGWVIAVERASQGLAGG